MKAVLLGYFFCEEESVMQPAVLRSWIKGAVFVAIGVLLPIAFHAVGAMGSVFLPMHIPVLLAGLLLGPVVGASVGALTPICSSLLTGMPPAFPTLPIMLAELAAYGWVSGYARRRAKLWTALIAALLSGRIAAGLMLWGLAHWVNLQWTPWGYLTLTLAKGLPGLIIQLIFIPLIVRRLEGEIIDEMQNLDSNAACVPVAYPDAAGSGSRNPQLQSGRNRDRRRGL